MSATATRYYIITCVQPWDIEIGSNVKDIALELSQKHKVLYVNTPLDGLTYYRGEDLPETIQRQRVINKQQPPIRQINEQLWVLDCPFWIWPTNFLPAPLFPIVNRWNNRQFFRYIRKTASDLGFDTPIHINDNDIFRSYYAQEYLPNLCSVYYRRDNFLSVDYWRKHGVKWEPMLVRKSDLVLTNSIELADAVRPYNSRAYDVGQGVDLTHYDLKLSYKEPIDMLHIAHPRVGYTGYLTSLRLDIDLLVQLAQSRPTIQFILVGPEDEDFQNSPLHQITNVHLLGSKPSSEIPSYMAYFDICLNPQIVNDATRGNYPRKVDEYLALGKPVIATRTPTMSRFEGYVSLCSTPLDYLSSIDSILQHPASDVQTKSYIDLAQSHSWSHSVGDMCQHIERYLSTKYPIL